MRRARFVSPPFHDRRPHLLRPVPVDPGGITGPTRKQARGPHFRRTSEAKYVSCAADPTTPEQRIVDAHEGLVLDGWVTGWAGLRWWGGYWFDGLDRDGAALPVPLVTSIDQTPPPGTLITRELLPDTDRTVRDGLPVATPVASLFHAVRRAPSLRSAVRAIDLAAYNDLVSIAEFGAFLETRKGYRGVVRARRALDLADENVLSPRECDLRVAWHFDERLPEPLSNAPVFNRAGKLLGVPDLLDPEAGLVVEYDGHVHLDAARRRRDRDREEGFRRVGLEVVTCLAGDSAAANLHRIHQGRRRARFESAETRAWTLDPPHWWVPTQTVEQRRVLAPDQRARLLDLRLHP